MITEGSLHGFGDFLGLLQFQTCLNECGIHGTAFRHSAAFIEGRKFPLGLCTGGTIAFLCSQVFEFCALFEFGVNAIDLCFCISILFCRGFRGKRFAVIICGHGFCQDVRNGDPGLDEERFLIVTVEFFHIGIRDSRFDFFHRGSEERLHGNVFLHSRIFGGFITVCFESLTLCFELAVQHFFLLGIHFCIHPV